MRSVFICTTLVLVSSVFSQRPFVRYSETLKKAVPRHYNHDQENADRGLDKIARGHKIEPRQPPLRPNQEIPWLRWVHEGRWAAQADKNSELHRVRARLLQEKLKPNNFAFKPVVNPQLKPKLKQKGNGRTKREAQNTEDERVQKETEIEGNVRPKRDVIMPQLVPELIMQPHFEAKMPQPSDQFNGRVKESEKREKRQILYFINKPPKLLARFPRTTPNPFIRDTHIEDYDIIRPEVGEREGMIPSAESGSSDLGSYPLVNEESSEFSQIIAQFFLATSDEYWPEIQRFADNILKPFSQLTVNKKELSKVLENAGDIGQNVKAMESTLNNLERYKTSSANMNINGAVHTRVKRRVNKTLKRKRAKKKKQRLRRFERKRLRMLTHARRVRKQQKSKQARLQRHYARMNMSTTETPEHLRNQTLIGEVEDHDRDESRTNEEDEDEEETDEEDDEYESSEYEDESESSETETKDESEGKTSKDKQEESQETDGDKTENSGSSSKPDDGNDDYEDYEDESDDDYEDFDSSEEESEEKKKKSGKGNKLKAAIKGRRKHKLQMLSRHKYNQQGRNLRNYASNKKTFHGENPSSINGNRRVNTNQYYKRNIYTDFEKKPLLSAQKQSLPVYKDVTQTNIKYFKQEMVNDDHTKIRKEYRNNKFLIKDGNIPVMAKESRSNTQWVPELRNKNLMVKGKFQSLQI